MGAQRSRCKRCGALILWARNPATGKMMPLDDASQVDVVLPQGRFAVVVTATGAHRVNVRSYTSHFASCPHADEFRKDKDRT